MGVDDIDSVKERLRSAVIEDIPITLLPGECRLLFNRLKRLEEQIAGLDKVYRNFKNAMYSLEHLL